jgi:hypothetical protein
VITGPGVAIAAAFFATLRQTPSFVCSTCLCRVSVPALGVTLEALIAAPSALAAFGQRPLNDATGFLHEAGDMPERNWRQCAPSCIAEVAQPGGVYDERGREVPGKSCRSSNASFRNMRETDACRPTSLASFLHLAGTPGLRRRDPPAEMRRSTLAEPRCRSPE